MTFLTTIIWHVFRVILGNCSGIQVVIIMWNGMELLTIEGIVVN